MTKIRVLYHRKSKCKNKDWEQVKYLKSWRRAGDVKDWLYPFSA